MNKAVLSIHGIILFIFIFTTTCFAQSGANNSISGFIFDATNRSPVAEVYVELLNDVYSSLRRIKTDNSGRYYFGGISKGNFKVKVLTYSTNYLEQTQDVEIVNNSFGGTFTSDSVYLDIYLKIDKRKLPGGELNPVGSVFVQDVPANARDLYKKGISQLEKATEMNEGLENIKKSLEIFPDYYDALNRMGIEHVRRNEYFESLPYLVKAIKINPRSFTGFYGLGLAAYNLKQTKEALEAFRAALVINPQSVLANLHLGTVLRVKGDFTEAEKSLLKAKLLSKDSPNGEIHWQLGLLYGKIERFSEAADEFERYLKVEPDASNIKQIKTVIAQLREKSKNK